MSPQSPRSGRASAEHVSDAADDRLSPFRDLTDRQLREGREREEGFFVAEGLLAIEALAGTGWPVTRALVTPSRAESHGDLLDQLAARGAEILVAERTVIDEVGGFPIHRGMLAVAPRPAPRSWQTIAARSHRLFLVEEVNDLENMGALFRVAAAFGVDGVILSPRCADPLYRRCVRVSTGSTLRVPFAVAPDWPAPLGDLAGDGWLSVALSPRGAVDISEVGAPERLALVLGAEGPGLADVTIGTCAMTARIEMSQGIDSLNVAVAAAVAAHATRRAGPSPLGQTSR
jgi:tRNA G18 (ribose-2'-O)-methylase SpoU